eukprot:m.1644154 g.1644154  ORF g.1644154 m.1644154 type:complete len:53 (+) comp61468_c0_seq1:85-243(+)
MPVDAPSRLSIVLTILRLDTMVYKNLQCVAWLHFSLYCGVLLCAHKLPISAN